MTSPFPEARLHPVSVRADAMSASFHFPAGHPCFTGHFDDDPILPGVVHVALAVATGAACGIDRPLAGLRHLRFLAPIRPDDTVEVTLHASDDARTARFEVRHATGVASMGTLLFAPGAGAIDHV